jgi:hypothetical protein
MEVLLVMLEVGPNIVESVSLLDLMSEGLYMSKFSLQLSIFPACDKYTVSWREPLKEIEKLMTTFGLV